MNSIQLSRLGQIMVGFIPGLGRQRGEQLNTPEKHTATRREKNGSGNLAAHSFREVMQDNKDWCQRSPSKMNPVFFFYTCLCDVSVSVSVGHWIVILLGFFFYLAVFLSFCQSVHQSALFPPRCLIQQHATRGAIVTGRRSQLGRMMYTTARSTCHPLVQRLQR